MGEHHKLRRRGRFVEKRLCYLAERLNLVHFIGVGDGHGDVAHFLVVAVVECDYRTAVVVRVGGAHRERLCVVPGRAVGRFEKSPTAYVA